ncbi:hypothetical protein [Streptomyces sp. NBC_01244]|uniref:hypothetical protein n=1 Tax=Streptomyces sp. NBC_01244 TaxID=2903797 RepID=UPI002E14CBD5|nr:hypothetical protein OG247_19120 [Streptomyces sp. NBC_01244]
MNSFKRTMTAVGTAVVLTAVGAVTAPAASAAQRAVSASAPDTKALQSSVQDAYIRTRGNQLVVYLNEGVNSYPYRVDVRRAGTDKVVAVVDDLEAWEVNPDPAGPDQGYVYEGVNQPLVLDDMTDYELDVYAKDSQGNELTRRNAGRSTYAFDARIEAKSSQQEFSLDDLDTQVTGTVTAVHPRTGERLPLAGARVRARLGEGWADGVSDAQGKFSIPVAARGTEKTLPHTVSLADGDTELSVTAPAKIRAQKSTLTLSTTAPLTVRYGTGAPLRGKLTRRADDGTVKPAAGRTVAASGIAQAQASTGADGSYTVSPRVLTTGPLNVSVDDAWLLGDGTRYATVTRITHTTMVVEEKVVATDRYGKLTISGTVRVDGYTTQQAPIEIQYKHYMGQWVTRQSFVVPFGKTFTVNVSPPSNQTTTQWRVHTPGTVNIGPSTGTVVLGPTRTLTRFSSVRVGPRPVAKGQQMFVAGTLSRKTPSGEYAGYAGQKVRFYFRPDKSTVWQEMGTAVTRENGAVGKKFTAQTTGDWRIRFVDTDSGHLATTSSYQRLEVTG